MSLAAWSQGDEVGELVGCYIWSPSFLEGGGGGGGGGRCSVAPLCCWVDESVSMKESVE